MEKSNENKAGFQHGLDQVYATRTAEEYKNCLREVMLVCMTTEASCNSKASFFNKRRGKRPLSVAESQRLAKVFAKYGVTEWQGGESELRVMNTRIARRLNEARKDEKTLKKAGQEVVDAHNIAVACGYIELPHLTFVDCMEEGDGVEVYVAPKSGMVALDDLYNLKAVWGADRVEVCFDPNNGGYICLIFKMK